MTDTQQRELKAFLEEQKALGCVRPTDLKNETTVWVSTDSIIVKIVVDKSYGSVKYVVDAGHSNLPRFHMGVSVNSHYARLNHTEPNYLGLGMSLVLEFSNGETVTFGEIQNVTIDGMTDDGKRYEYDVW